MGQERRESRAEREMPKRPKAMIQAPRRPRHLGLLNGSKVWPHRTAMSDPIPRLMALSPRTNRMREVAA